jgi:RNA polymerase sigma-70 factor (ECF subfamily)
MTATLTRTPPTTVTRPVPVAASTALDDRELVARAGRGDREALGELYRRHRASVTGYVRRRITADADTEDVVHEAFLHAWNTAGDYEPEHGYTVRSWLCGRAAQALRRHSWNELHPYRAAVDASREALRRPVTESAEQREARPVSETVRAALETLTPGERRAVHAYYLDGLSGEQAAEAVGCKVGTLRINTMTARRKLARALADQAPAARSPLQEISQHEAVRDALAAVGRDVTAARAWLAERGVPVSRSSLYRAVRRENAGDTHTESAASLDQTRGQVDYTPPETVMALARPTQRARAAARDYRERHGRLPTMTELADAVHVERATAGYALRDIKAGRAGRYYADAATTAKAEPAGVAETARATGASGGATEVGHQERRDQQRRAAVTAPRRPRGTDTTAAAHAVDPRAGRARPRDAQPRVQVVDTGTHRHRTAVPSPAAQTMPRPRNDATRDAQASTRTERKDSAAEDDTTAAPSAEVSIARARVALAVLNAHRAEQDTRQAIEHARSEQLNRWHHDDHASTGRTSGAGRANHGEGHAR